ncbi:MAG: sigma-54-dependent transcriptional regulator [Gammaproteobacteria bacterium]
MSRILVIEDEAVIRSAVKRLLERNDYEVEDASSVADASERLDIPSFDLILTDLRLPGAPGTDVIPLAGDVPVLIMTSYSSVRSAVESIKLGAVDYIAKPFDHDELLVLVDRVLRQSRMARSRDVLKKEVDTAYPVGGIVGNCPAMREVFSRINKSAPTDTTVLILGESGTGKELVARAVHEKSHRSESPIIAVNCAAIPDEHIESELFGHEQGAFPGATETRRGLVEAADGGTLFLDEIGELPMAAQARLLRVLQDGEIRRLGSHQARNVNVRLVTATNRDLSRMVQEGDFRSDLYFRLRVMEIRLPPLRERGEDIPKLTHYLLEKTCQRLNRAPITLTSDVLDTVLAYDWPGNVRELENAIERAVILCDGTRLSTDLLAIESSPPPAPARDSDPASPASQSLEEYFRHFVETHQGTLTETELAKRLGISRKALWERRQRLGIPRPKKSDRKGETE